MADEPPNNVLPFRPRAVAEAAPEPVVVDEPRPLTPTPNFPFHPVTLEEILDAWRQVFLLVTEGGVMRGLPKNVLGMEQAFMAMSLGWFKGIHCSDPVTGVVTIVLPANLVKQIEQGFEIAGVLINRDIIAGGLRVKPSYLTENVQQPDEPDPEPDPGPQPTAA